MVGVRAAAGRDAGGSAHHPPRPRPGTTSRQSFAPSPGSRQARRLAEARWGWPRAAW